MDDVLQRLLAVEEEARQKVRDAEVEAKRIHQEARRELSALQETFQQQLTHECERCVAERVEQAEARKHREIGKAETEIAARRARLMARVGEAAGAVVEMLAFPAGR